MEDPESYFACTVGNGITTQQKMELLNRVIRLLPFIPNGKSGVDIRTIHNLEKLTGYCTKQFEWHRPSYEVIDPVSSDVDVSHYLHYKQDGTEWKTRHEAIPPRAHNRLSTQGRRPFGRSRPTYLYRGRTYKCSQNSACSKKQISSPDVGKTSISFGFHDGLD